MIENLAEIFEYREGVLCWKGDRGWNKLAGKPAGTVHHSGYLQVKIGGKTQFVHRVIFLMHHGYLPPYLDHIDGNRRNNRIENLRPATASENNCNRRGGLNSSGVKGVSWNTKRKKWAAQIKIHRGVVFLGHHESKEAAGRAVREARTKLHGEFANHGGAV